MTTKIDGQIPGIDYADVDAENIRGLRGAVVERTDDRPVHADLAPLWNELLAPIEELIGADERHGLPLAPPSNDPASDSAVETARELRHASRELNHLAKRSDDPRIDALASIARKYADLRYELLGRTRL